MLIAASVDAARDYKLIYNTKPPQTPVDKGFCLARMRAEPARALATLARSRARYARVLPCGMMS